MEMKIKERDESKKEKVKQRKTTKLWDQQHQVGKQQLKKCFKTYKDSFAGGV